MKKYIASLLLMLLLFGVELIAQVNQNTKSHYDNNGRDTYGNQIDPDSQAKNLDNTNVEVKSLPPKLYGWLIKDIFGNREILPADTSYFQLHSRNLTDGLNGEYNYLGNLASPRLSRLFFNRTNDSPTIFVQPFSSIFTPHNKFLFTNSNVPFTNLRYNKGGRSLSAEEWFNFYFSVNANKRLAFGFNFDYLYARGVYRNQSVNFFNATVFGSYIGDRYELQTMYSNNFFKLNENGGIADDRYITSPEEMAEGRRTIEHANIPVVLTATGNKNHTLYGFLTHRYNLGFEKEVYEDPKDSTKVKDVFVPVTSFIHTFKIDRATKRSGSSDNVAGYYKNTYLNLGNNYVNDSTRYVGIKNVVGISLREGFHKYAKAGITLFASHKLSYHWLMEKDIEKSYKRYAENDFFVGGELAKKQGRTLRYRALAEIGVLGSSIGEFNVNGDINLNLRLLKDTISFTVRAMSSLKRPEFYMRHYHSTHFWWDDDMEKEFRTRLEGEINIRRLGTSLKAGIENIKNYTYLGTEATPEQKKDNIQIAYLSAKQNLNWGIWHFDNEVAVQKTSNSDIIPLPLVSLYSNMYLKFRAAKKVLGVQLGVDMRYFTEYYSPAYIPALQQFHLQDESNRVKVGNYPIVNAYVNLQIKQIRFFLMMSHINDGLMRNKSFLVPHYPINPRTFRLGLTWNFYD